MPGTWLQSEKPCKLGNQFDSNYKNNPIAQIIYSKENIIICNKKKNEKERILICCFTYY